MKKVLYLVMIGMAGYGLAQDAFVYVEPETTVALPGGNFTIAFNVADVVELYAWQVDFSWDPTLLHLANLREGSFLNQNGQKPSFFVTYYDDTANGRASLGATLLGNSPGTSGSGTLGYADFTVKSLYGSCPLTMYGIMLLDPDIVEMPWTKRDGFFTTGEAGVMEVDADCKLSLGAIIGPAVGSLAFEYFVPEPALIELMLYDACGRMIESVSEGQKNRGWHKASVPACLPGGIYFVRLEIGNETFTRKVVVLK